MKIKHYPHPLKSCENCKYCEWWYEYYRCNHDEWDNSHEPSDEPNELMICDKWESKGN